MRALLVLFLFTLFLIENARSQSIDQSEKHYPSILFGAGYMKFTGDVGKLNDVSPLLDSRFGYYLKAEYRLDRKSTRLNSSHSQQSRMPSSA